MITFMPRLQWSLKRDTITWNQFSNHNYTAAFFSLFIISLSQLYNTVVLHCTELTQGVPQFQDYFVKRKLSLK